MEKKNISRWSYPDGEEDETGGRTSCQNLQLSKRNATLPDGYKYTFVSAYLRESWMMIHQLTVRSDVKLCFSKKKYTYKYKINGVKRLTIYKWYHLRAIQSSLLYLITTKDNLNF